MITTTGRVNYEQVFPMRLQGLHLPPPTERADATMKPCKDCQSATRKVTPPGPRCATCHRARRKATREAAHGLRILKTYGITSEQYEALYRAQEGVCYICRRARGLTKKLSVDHDHKTGYVRGLCCSTCNNILGHLRDDPEAAWRIFKYLKNPPAFKVIGKVRPDGTE